MNRFELLLGYLAGHIEIPRSYYDLGADRHMSLGRWLMRDGSQIARLGPDIHPQGSFRFGVVTRPLNADADYDLDNVCTLMRLDKLALTQADLKALFGAEIRAYAQAKNMKAEPTEHPRCWRLNYADEGLSFHLDSVPCVPDVVRQQRLIESYTEIDPAFAQLAVAITDTRHPSYRRRSANWPTTNPRGFAQWFEQRAAYRREMQFAESVGKAIEGVPTYAWSSPLQRVIILLKRHRDVMFLRQPTLAPISMIITNLAAHAYDGESDTANALTGIVQRMGRYVRDEPPYVPNPTDPDEDYADRWLGDPRLRENFWMWHEQLERDVRQLERAAVNGASVGLARNLFQVELTGEEQRALSTRSQVARVAPVSRIATGPRPWGHGR